MADKWSAVGNLALDAFRHQLGGTFGFILEVAVTAAFFHGAQRSHAAVSLVGSALIKKGLARRFVGAGKETADHHRMGAAADGLGDIAGKLDAAIGDNRHTVPGRGDGTVVDGGHLRHPDSGDDPGGADRARPDPDLDAVGAGLDQVLRALGGCDVAGNDLQGGKGIAQAAHRIENIFGMTMGRIEHDDIHPGLDQVLNVSQTGVDADGGPDPQPSHRIFRRLRVFANFLDILDGDQSLEIAFVVNHQELLDPVLVQQLFRVLQGDADRRGDQALAGHDLPHLEGRDR